MQICEPVAADSIEFRPAAKLPLEQFDFANSLPIPLVLKLRKVVVIPIREKDIGPAQGGVVDLKQLFQGGSPTLQILQPLDKPGSLPKVAK